MKKFLTLALALLFLLCLCACSSEIQLKDDDNVTMVFRYDYKNLRRTLNDEESAEIIKILNGKRSFDFANTDESCGFSEDVSLIVDGITFAVARDGCHMMKNLSTDEVLLLSEPEMEYIIALYDTYGGYFPCIDTK